MAGPGPDLLFVMDAMSDAQGPGWHSPPRAGGMRPQPRHARARCCAQGFQASEEMRAGPVGALLEARAKLAALEAAIAAVSPPAAEGERGGGSRGVERSQAGLLQSLEAAAAAVKDGGVPSRLLRMLKGELAVERAQAVIEQIRAQARFVLAAFFPGTFAYSLRPRRSACGAARALVAALSAAAHGAAIAGAAR